MNKLDSLYDKKRNEDNMKGKKLLDEAMREKKDHKKGDCGKVKKFAMGGVAKIRHGEATEQGLPKNFKKKSINSIMR